MDWNRYKQLCDAPNVLSRWMLEQTRELVEQADLADLLCRVLNQIPLEKPEDHRGGEATDMFELTLTPAEACAISERIAAAAGAGQSTAATKDRGLGGFREAWAEYRRFLDSAVQPTIGRKKNA